MHFKINLTLVAILAIVLFFNIPFYNHWLNTNILNPAISISSTYKVLDNEQRMVSRFGYTYSVYKEMSAVFKKAKIKDPVVLLPPDAYLKEKKIIGILVVEPAIYYYFTGQKAVWYDSPDVLKANCAMVPGNQGKITVRKINNRDELNALLNIYKNYKLDL